MTMALPRSVDELRARATLAIASRRERPADFEAARELLREQVGAWAAYVEAVEQAFRQRMLELAKEFGRPPMQLEVFVNLNWADDQRPVVRRMHSDVVCILESLESPQP